MRKLLLGLAGAITAASPAAAALPVGAKAPNFVTTGAMAGKPFQLNLKRELRKGPVVLYFFPKAFTKGCTLEARAFSEASDEFRKAGARVIGMSADDLPTLKRFSVEECRNAFPVATATAATVNAYDVAMPVVGKLTTMSNRTSYVIDRNGRIAFVHSKLDWSGHVKKTLAAVKGLKKR
ncbi:redoxin domain-containing protein [Sphingomonas sp.]|uniref:peroxiredoxin n=1 Tax=Sphingomonas sp. TaxID=28214 RepID=UPI0017B424F8|nr:redoxin domain-containing protein [Sphingomonas sp.]MBA3510527.1 redoxin domain-containing protein [Sphingomonas sp.]